MDARTMVPGLLLLPALLVLPGAASAACEGGDLRNALPPETMREIRARISNAPFGKGVAFEAVRDDARLTFFGTVHTSSCLVSVPEEIGMRIREADLLFVEVTSELEAEFERHLGANPSAILDPEGPGLKARLTEREWGSLVEALSELGVPAEAADRMRPGFAAMMLQVPPCEMVAFASGDTLLDRRVETLARTAGVMVESLDSDFEEVLGLFLDGPEEAQIDMLRASLASGDAEDALMTAIATWRDEEPLMLREVSREHAALLMDAGKVAELFERVEDTLLIARNRRWLTRILDRARQVRSVVVAVGALHLPGEHGLLRRLEAAGFAIRRLDVF